MATVIVRNISAETPDVEIKEFFSFCGNIANAKITEVPETMSKEASITFEKESAMGTALLLNKTELGGRSLSVTSASASGSSDEEAADQQHGAEAGTDATTQEGKPRSRIVAELLAHGYLVGNTAAQRALDFDAKHGVWARFLNTLQGIDEKLHATDKARTADASYGITQRAGSLLTNLSSYFEKATNTPTGKRIVEFYGAGQRQVADIHAEAKRLAELKKEAAGGSSYKAAGLERVFGKEAASQGEAEGQTHTDATTGTESSAPTAAAGAIPAVQL